MIDILSTITDKSKSIAIVIDSENQTVKNEIVDQDVSIFDTIDNVDTQSDYCFISVSL